MTAGWLTEFVESKASAGGGQPGHLGNETLTQGISHAPRLENLATRSLHRIFIGRDTLNACIDRARNIPPAVMPHLKTCGHSGVEVQNQRADKVVFFGT